MSTPQAFGVPSSGSAPHLSKSLPIPAGSVSQNRARCDLGTVESGRPIKRTRIEETADHSKAPTLLDRLGSSISRQPSLPGLPSRTQINFPLLKVDSPSQSSQGFSIKGAAAKEANHDTDLNHRAPSSLLERLRDSWSDDNALEQKKRRKKRNV